MGKNLLNVYENGDMLDEMLDEMAVGAIREKRQPKVRGGQKDQKRLRNTYISANKKGAASRAARSARYAEENEKPQGRFEKSEFSELQDELCGKKYGKRR